MKKFVITIAAFGLLCSPVSAKDKCETEIPELIKKVKETTLLMDAGKKKYVKHLEEALKHCQAGDLESTEKEIQHLKDQFFHDALYNQQTYYGN